MHMCFHFLGHGEMTEVCWTKDHWNLLVYVARCSRILIRKQSHSVFFMNPLGFHCPSASGLPLGLTCLHYGQLPREGD